jgi:hypothetical protein
MPDYSDPRIFEIITPTQLQTLQNEGYMLVRQSEVRDLLIESEWLTELFNKAVNILRERDLEHPGSAGIYHLRHRVEILDGVYVDPDDFGNE